MGCYFASGGRAKPCDHALSAGNSNAGVELQSKMGRLLVIETRQAALDFGSGADSFAWVGEESHQAIAQEFVDIAMLFIDDG
jgi:hypothetical protein